MRDTKKILIITDIIDYSNKLQKYIKLYGEENIFNIQIANLTITDPFDEIMKSIIVSIYEYNIKDIVFLKSGLNISYSEKRIKRNSIIEYHFKNCSPEFFKSTLDDWFLDDSVENSVEIVKYHPLIPNDVNILIK
ncbi:carbonic anhydrase [Staphylococcus massiliensis]|uniref:Carbonic anhydrase n=1 Tax=Staphylococcus massiliensis S46 TaxID=1229783 RepID=K9ADB9_9STAP|nr:carbonic anhydrase [Staphylococcus massiliensis]EKU45294.1 carbonic anhydrase [Staphylococcus massiliensis S46]MCG3400682.1 carbonic anhydrase [Staphylococcus massiliensis]MCG3413603.1 carbonic anhydrase [Staphylococcus massiliensis]